MREISHAATQSVHEYVWCVKWDQGERNGDWEDRTRILPIVNCVWRQRACKLPHCAIDLDMAFWHDYISSAWIHRSQKAFFASHLQLLGRTSAGRGCFGADIAGFASALEISSGATPGFYLLRGCWFNCLAPEAPLIRRIPTGPKVFLEMPDACGLRPCHRTHLKKGLVLYLSGVGTENKYRKRFLLHLFSSWVALLIILCRLSYE